MADTERTQNPKNPTSGHLEPLVVRPRAAWRLLGCGNAYGYRLIAAGELESYLDGRARKITMASIRRRIERQIILAAKTTAVTTQRVAWQRRRSSEPRKRRDSRRSVP
jgi:hypothetical protein